MGPVVIETIEAVVRARRADYEATAATERLLRSSRPRTSGRPSLLGALLRLLGHPAPADRACCPGCVA